MRYLREIEYFWIINKVLYKKKDSAPNIKYLISDIYSKKPIKFFLQLIILSRKNYDTRWCLLKGESQEY